MRTDPILEIYVDYNNIDNCLLQKYIDQIEIHNNSDNSGFDLFFPEETIFSSIDSKMVKFNIKCVMRDFYGGSAVGYYLYPRSSLSKTPLMLANHVGIIDAGYRGEIIGAFRLLQSEPYIVRAYERVLQICKSDLRKFNVILSDISNIDNTLRGAGGFGSTGN
jgi:dUTP pyrophosphatase